MTKETIEKMKEIKVTAINSNYVKNDTVTNSQVISLHDVYIYQTECTELAKLSKAEMRVLQNNTSGVRLKKNAVLNGQSVNYFDYWDGLVFVDIDCKNHWSLEDNNSYIKTLHHDLSSFSWYLWTTTSASGNGIHIVCYFPSRFHTESEYYTSAAIAHSHISSYLSQLIHLTEQELVDKGIIDTHNFTNYAQCFKFTYAKTLVNDRFDPQTILNCNFKSDDYYREYAISNNIINKVFWREICKVEHKMSNNLRGLSSDHLPKDISLNSNAVALDFKYSDRLQLVYTLKNYYSDEDTFSICDQLYKATYGIDAKYNERMNEIKSIISSYKNQNVNMRIVRILMDSYNFFPGISVGSCVVTDNMPHNTYILTEEQHLSDIMDKVMNNLEDITVLDSPAASGKTTAIANFQENLIMTEPYTAIIKNKVEHDPTLQMFGCLYDRRRITDDKYVNTKKFCCTPNNLITIPAEELLKRDIKYVFIDESHTIISDSEFRLNVMSDFVKTLQEYVSVGIKVVLLTATTLGEAKFIIRNLPNSSVQYIKVERSSVYKKTLTVKRFKTTKDRKSALCDDIAQALKEGYKCIVPTNAGDKIVSGIDACIKSRCQNVVSRKVFSDDNLSTYYTRKNRFLKPNEDITESSSIDNVSIVFAGTSFGVGLDINNTEKCKVFFPDLIPAYDIEQFAARLRRTDKECYLYVDKETHPNMDYLYQTKAKPHNDIDIKYAKSLIEDVNKKNCYCNFVSIEDAILERFPYISFDLHTRQYYINELSWALSMKCYEIKNYWSQLISIKSICQNQYGFSIADNHTFLSGSKETVKSDENTIRSAYKKRNMLIYNAALDILQNDFPNSEAQLYHIAKVARDSIRKVVYEDIIELLDNKASTNCIKIILSDCLDHDSMKYDTKVMGSIKKFVKINSLYASRNDRTIQEYVQKYRDFVIAQDSRCRRETLAGFINSLEAEAKNDERISEDNFISIISKAIMKKEKEKGKSKTYIITVREFPELLNSIAQAKASSVYEIACESLFTL